ncbi:MAG: DUF2461 family protein [Vicinamibacteria bacterium]
MPRSTLDFLKRLARHNNRDWFNAHRDEYQAAIETRSSSSMR